MNTTLLSGRWKSHQCTVRLSVSALSEHPKMGNVTFSVVPTAVPRTEPHTFTISSHCDLNYLLTLMSSVTKSIRTEDPHPQNPWNSMDADRGQGCRRGRKSLGIGKCAFCWLLCFCFDRLHFQNGAHQLLFTYIYTSLTTGRGNTTSQKF